MKDINQFLTDLVNGSTHIISNPKTIKDLMEKGVKFDQPSTSKSTEELIADLFEKRKQQALELKIYNNFPPAPNIAVPTITSLYDEIRECILFGLFGAAISLSSVLVEFSLKHAIVKYNKGHQYDKQEWDRIENMELNDVIVEAKKLHILNKTWVKMLESFRDDLRNPYLHYNIKKITKNVVAGKTKRVNINTQQVIEEDIIAEDNPITWTLAKKFVDKEHVLKVFNFTDTLIKYLHMKCMTFEELKDHIEETLGLKYLEKAKDQASHNLYSFINEETQEKYVLKELKENDFEVITYINYLPQIKTEFKVLALPEAVAAFNAKDYHYLLIPWYEGERFDFNTSDLRLAEELVDIVVDLSSVDISHLLKDKAEFDYKGFESNFWRYLDKAISIGIINAKDEKTIKEQCAKVLASGRENQKMVVCNGDFNPRNVIRHKSGKLTLIDWEGIIFPLEHMLTYPWLLNWQNPIWQKKYASKFESKLSVDTNHLKMHLMNIALIRAVAEKGHNNSYADMMSEDHMKKFFASLSGFQSLTEL